MGVFQSYADPRVTQRCKELLVSWANEFKSESSMTGLLRFVEQLRKDGISFQGLQQSSSSSTSAPTQVSWESQLLPPVQTASPSLLCISRWLSLCNA